MSNQVKLNGTATDYLGPVNGLDGGNDIITAYVGGYNDVSAVVFNGQGGDDTLVGGALNDTITGGAGNDSIVGADGNDSLLGNQGNDTLEGGAGDDYLHGGQGADSLLGGDGADTLTGGKGSDWIAGGEGNDLIDESADTNGVDAVLGNVVAGNNTIYGNQGNDSVYGGSSADYIHGGQGNDFIIGNGGNDTLLGGKGSDHLFGGLGNDVIDLADNGNSSEVDYVYFNINESAADGSADDIQNFVQGVDKIRLLDLAGTANLGQSVTLATAVSEVLTPAELQDSGTVINGNVVTFSNGTSAVFEGVSHIYWDDFDGVQPLTVAVSSETIFADDTGTFASGLDFIEGYNPANVTLEVTSPLTLAQAQALADAGFKMQSNVTYDIEDTFSTLQAARTSTLLAHASDVTLVGSELDNTIDVALFTKDLSIEAGDGNDTINAGKGDDSIAGEGGADTINLTKQDQSHDSVVYTESTDGASFNVARAHFGGESGTDGIYNLGTEIKIELDLTPGDGYYNNGWTTVYHYVVGAEGSVTEAPSTDGTNDQYNVYFYSGTGVDDPTPGDRDELLNDFAQQLSDELNLSTGIVYAEDGSIVIRSSDAYGPYSLDTTGFGSDAYPLPEIVSADLHTKAIASTYSATYDNTLEYTKDGQLSLTFSESFTNGVDGNGDPIIVTKEYTLVQDMIVNEGADQDPEDLRVVSHSSVFIPELGADYYGESTSGAYTFNEGYNEGEKITLKFDVSAVGTVTLQYVVGDATAYAYVDAGGQPVEIASFDTGSTGGDATVSDLVGYLTGLVAAVNDAEPLAKLQVFTAPDGSGTEFGLVKVYPNMPVPGHFAVSSVGLSDVDAATVTADEVDLQATVEALKTQFDSFARDGDGNASTLNTAFSDTYDTVVVRLDAQGDVIADGDTTTEVADYRLDITLSDAHENLVTDPENYNLENFGYSLGSEFVNSSEDLDADLLLTKTDGSDQTSEDVTATPTTDDVHFSTDSADYVVGAHLTLSLDDGSDPVVYTITAADVLANTTIDGYLQKLVEAINTQEGSAGGYAATAEWVQGEYHAAVEEVLYDPGQPEIAPTYEQVLVPGTGTPEIPEVNVQYHIDVTDGEDIVVAQGDYSADPADYSTTVQVTLGDVSIYPTQSAIDAGPAYILSLLQSEYALAHVGAGLSTSMTEGEFSPAVPAVPAEYTDGAVLDPGQPYIAPTAYVAPVAAYYDTGYIKLTAVADGSDSLNVEAQDSGVFYEGVAYKYDLVFTSDTSAYASGNVLKINLGDDYAGLNVDGAQGDIVNGVYTYTVSTTATNPFTTVQAVVTDLQSLLSANTGDSTAYHALYARLAADAPGGTGALARTISLTMDKASTTDVIEQPGNPLVGLAAAIEKVAYDNEVSVSSSNSTSATFNFGSHAYDVGDVLTVTVPFTDSTSATHTYKVQYVAGSNTVSWDADGDGSFESSTSVTAATAAAGVAGIFIKALSTTADQAVDGNGDFVTALTNVFTNSTSVSTVAGNSVITLNLRDNTDSIGTPTIAVVNQLPAIEGAVGVLVTQIGKDDIAATVEDTGGVTEVLGLDDSTADSATAAEVTVDFGDVDLFKGQSISVTVDENGSAVGGEHTYTATLAGDTKADLYHALQSIVEDINGDTTFAADHTVTAAIDSWADEQTPYTGDYVLTLTGDIKDGVADTAAVEGSDAYDTATDFTATAKVEVNHEIVDYPTNGVDDGSDSLRTVESASSVEVDLTHNGGIDNQNFYDFEWGTTGSDWDVVNNFQIGNDQVLIGGDLAITTGSGRVDYVEGYEHWNGGEWVGSNFELGSDEFGIAGGEDSVYAAQLTDAVAVANSLNSKFDFTATSDNVRNTSIFAVTAIDKPNETAIWVHTQSYAGDDTVSADELQLLSVVHTNANSLGNGSFDEDNLALSVDNVQAGDATVIDFEDVTFDQSSHTYVQSEYEGLNWQFAPTMGGGEDGTMVSSTENSPFITGLGSAFGFGVFSEGFSSPDQSQDFDFVSGDFAYYAGEDGNGAFTVHAYDDGVEVGTATLTYQGSSPYAYASVDFAQGTTTLGSLDVTGRFTSIDSVVLDGNNGYNEFIYDNLVLSGGQYGGSLSGTDGNDSLVGTYLSETLDGQAGNDTLEGGRGVDTLTGGTGEDVFVFSDSINDYKADLISWDGNHDGKFNDQISDNSIETGDQFKNFDLITDFAPGDTIQLPSDSDYISSSDYLDDSEDVIFVRGTVDSHGVFTAGDVGADHTMIVFQNGKDAGLVVLNGLYDDLDKWSIDNGALRYDTEFGSDSDDSLSASSDAHYVNGFDGDDTIVGSDANDTLIGGAGADTLTGGDGVNTFVFESDDGVAATEFDNGVFTFDNGVDVITDFKSQGNATNGDIASTDNVDTMVFNGVSIDGTIASFLALGDGAAVAGDSVADDAGVYYFQGTWDDVADQFTLGTSAADTDFMFVNWAGGADLTEVALVGVSDVLIHDNPALVV